MAGLQTIIDSCNGMGINRRKVAGIQFTRNEIPRVSQTPTKNPWKFTLDMPNKFRYSEARDLMEALDTLDRITPQTVTFSNNPAFSWMFKYQGEMSSPQISAITVVSYIGNQLVLSGLPLATQTSVLFRPNDLIQISGHPYPFTSTGTVLRGLGSTVTVTTSRPNIITSSVVGDGIIVGNDCTFNVFCPNMPTYKLTVGGQLMNGSTVQNNAILEWSDSFELYEFVGSA